MASRGAADTFPSSFDLELKFLPKTDVRVLLQRFEEKCRLQEFDSDDDRITVYNLMTLFYWLLKRKDEAWEYNKKAIELNANNLIALSNRQHMSIADGRVGDADDCMIRLRKIVTQPYAGDETGDIDPKVTAMAEHAYSYSCCGPKYYKRAAELYRKAIEEAGTAADVTSWKYGQGLSLRRLVHFHKNHKALSKSEIRDLQIDSAQVLTDVAIAGLNERLQAKAWVQLGEIVNTLRDSQEEKEYILPRSIARYEAEDLFKRGLETYRNDVTVLETCGKFYRYTKNYEKSVELLQESLNIRETGYAHHHLAKTLKEMEKSRQKSTLEGFSSRGRSHPGLYRGNRKPQRGRGEQNKDYSRADHSKAPSIWLKTSWITLQGNEQTDDIIYHLDQAVALSNSSYMMMDKAMVFRDMGKLQEAIQILETAVSCCTDEGRYSMLCNFLEQIGQCCIFMTNTSCPVPDKRSYKIKAIKSLKAAIEIATTEIEKGTFTTVEDLVNTTVAPPDSTGQVARLVFLVSKYKEVINFVDEPWISSVDEQDRHILQYLQSNNLDDAILLLNLQNCTEQVINKDLFLRCQLQGAINALKSGRMVLAQVRLQECMMFHRQMKMMPICDTEDPTSPDRYNAFLIADVGSHSKPNICNLVASINSYLKNCCGLDVLSSAEDFDEEIVTQSEISKYILRSDHVLIVVSSTDPGNFCKETTGTVLSLMKERKVSAIVVRLDSSPVPENLTRLPVIDAYSSLIEGTSVKEIGNKGLLSPAKHGTRNTEQDTTTSDRRIAGDDVEDVTRAFDGRLGLGEPSSETVSPKRIGLSEVRLAEQIVVKTELIEWTEQLFGKLMNIQLSF